MHVIRPLGILWTGLPPALWRKHAVSKDLPVVTPSTRAVPRAKACAYPSDHEYHRAPQRLRRNRQFTRDGLKALEVRCSGPVRGIGTEIARGKEAPHDWVGSPFLVVAGRDAGVPGVVRSLCADSEVSITGLPLGEERDSEQFHSKQGGLHPSTESDCVVTRSRPTCLAHMGPRDLGRPS